MPKAGDFTTIAKVKGWLATGGKPFPATDDELLGRLVTSATRFLITWLSRDIAATDYTVVLNGNGGVQIFPEQYPVIAVASLGINGTAVAPRSGNNAFSSGYSFDAESIYVGGNFFSCGFQNITLSYSAGYQVRNEPSVIPNDNINFLRADTLARTWVNDRGISLVNGVKLLKVPSAPIVGQYAVAIKDGVFGYQFSTADAVANSDILVSYGYCPEDLEQAMIEMICEKYSTRERIGQVSKAFGGEVVSFSQKDFNAHAADVFSQYKNVVPV